MKMFERLFNNNGARRCACSDPENLPGTKKQSFVLPFRGGEIWFEHLDGMYQYTGLAIEKLRKDSRIFLLPSKPSQIGIVLDESIVTRALAEEIAGLLCGGRKRFMRVCFIGTDRKIESMLRRALPGKSGFALSFINDFDQAKEWLVSEKVYD